MKFIGKYLIVILLSITLAISVFFNIKLKNDSYINSNIVGTFCTGGDFPVPDAEYIVFLRDFKYKVYRQHEAIIEEGTYTAEKELVTLKFNDSKRYITHINEKIYDTSGDGVKLYLKISDVPTYINVK